MFESNIINIYGKKGQQWLDDLPKLITQVEATYGLSNLKPVEALSYNYVLSGFQGSQPIILKLGLDIDGFKREAAALTAFEESGVVQIFSENTGLLLLECALPGVSLKSYFPENDDEAINITANVIKRLHKAPIPSTHAFLHIKDWLAVLDSDLKIPLQTLQKSREIRDKLLITAEPDVLLHGDLHHDNILQNGQGWLVIDPKGVIGEPAYEVAAFIRNPIPELLNHADAPNIIHNRVTRFAELLELPSQRILDWCFVQAVLSWVWAIEDGCDASYSEKITGIFDVMINPIKKSLQENS
jgi:streptomycin 6-kinase